MPTLLDNIRTLCDETRMLACLTASYGTAAWCETVRYGRAQETDAAGRPCERPLREDTLFDLASLTKLFTGVMVMMLVERGRVSLDETIRGIDPRFVHLGETTLGDTLCFLANLQTQGRIDQAESREEGLKLLFGIRREETAPVRIYSDMNAMVCKYVVEARTGMAFADALRRYIFDPLGLHDTTPSVGIMDAARCVAYNREHQVLRGSYLLREDLVPGRVNDPKAKVLSPAGEDLCGHAGLFSTAGDMARLCQGLLSGALIRRETLCLMGQNRTGRANADGTHRQYMGYMCFAKHPNQRLSELPSWMPEGAMGLSGFTGNHLAIDPIGGTFLVYLGNRCHNRVSRVVLREGERFEDLGLAADGTGFVHWPDGRAVPCSAEYVRLKDRMLHRPVADRLRERGMLPGG